MTVSDLLKERNRQILERYNQLKQLKMKSNEAKKIISTEFDNLSLYTIDQVIYNKNYSNSPYPKE
ncbi:MAG: hypothetical protein BM557_09270 [Flavobacterium sp. MedPE-SWcel]|uniref:hypothetical protein n=1 Tax=uncultured Flavobacterium sp. TaxID=165435 RepID=UPI00091D448E|nr:hypothetical protein [uncultured Flavobacterium sp.]OIQ16928.1 MAG: hypothetical protein BM557_09270 [Flavobacterium sp. MedPE-SWcel]